MDERDKNIFFLTGGRDGVVRAIEWLADAGVRDPLDMQTVPPGVRRAPDKSHSDKSHSGENQFDKSNADKGALDKRQFDKSNADKGALDKGTAIQSLPPSSARDFANTGAGSSPPAPSSNVPPASPSGSSDTRVDPRPSTASLPPSPSPNVPPALPSGSSDTRGASSRDASPPTPAKKSGREEIANTGTPGDQHLAVTLAGECQSLADLKSRIDGFTQCPLRQTAENTVFGRGAEDSDLMIVGEAPGDEEDKQGKPFVGASGQLLDVILAAVGFAPDSVRIGNILPWRPPGNRTPLSSEISLCLPFIERHIALVRPKILIALGGVAAKALLGRTDGITMLRRQWFSYESPQLQRPIPLKPTFHPAYLLRSPGQKRLVWQDFLAIRAKHDG